MTSIRVVAAIIEDLQGRVFIAKRLHGAWAETWEFPGGKVENGESPRAALLRELVEEGVINRVEDAMLDEGPPLFKARILMDVNISHFRVRACSVNVDPPLINPAHTRFAWREWALLRRLAVSDLSPGMATILGCMKELPRV